MMQAPLHTTTSQPMAPSPLPLIRATHHSCSVRPKRLAAAVIRARQVARARQLQLCLKKVSMVPCRRPARWPVLSSADLSAQAAELHVPRQSLAGLLVYPFCMYLTWLRTAKGQLV